MELTREQQEKLFRLVSNHLRIIDNQDSFKYLTVDEVIGLNGDIADFRTIKRVMESELAQPKETLKDKIIDLDLRLGSFELMSSSLITFIQDSTLTEENRESYPKDVTKFVDLQNERARKAKEHLDALVHLLIGEHIL